MGVEKFVDEWYEKNERLPMGRTSIVDVVRAAIERDRERLERTLNAVTNMFCECGGGDPSTGCGYCKMYHEIKRIVRMEERDRGEREKLICHVCFVPIKDGEPYWFKKGEPVTCHACWLAEQSLEQQVMSTPESRDKYIEEIIRLDRETRPDPLSADLVRLAERANNKAIALFHIDNHGWAITEKFHVQLSGTKTRDTPRAAVDAALQEIDSRETEKP